MHSFYHAGDIGDTIYGMYVVRALGGGDVWLGERAVEGLPQPRVGITGAVFHVVCPLLRTQSYIKNVGWVSSPPPVTYDLNLFRRFWSPENKLPRTTTLLEMHCHAFGLRYNPAQPWLEAGANRVARVVFARSPRQQNWRFPWRALCERYKKDAIFIGTPEEHKAFCDVAGIAIPRYHTVNFTEVAEVINGSDLFVGNSSAPLSVAEGLKKTLVQEGSLRTVERAHTVQTRAGAECWFDEEDLQQSGVLC